jgi:hypothetical protein
MADSVIFSLSEANRKKTIYSEEDGKSYWETRQDVDPIIQHASEVHDHVVPSRELRHAAFIPMIVLDQSMREKWEPKDWKKWANDPANECFRTWKGRL